MDVLFNKNKLNKNRVTIFNQSGEDNFDSMSITSKNKEPSAKYNDCITKSVSRKYVKKNYIDPTSGF